MDTLVLTQKGSNGKVFALKDEWLCNGMNLNTGTFRNMYKDVSINETRIGDKVYRNGNVYLSYSPTLESVKVQFSATKLLYGSSLFEYDVNDSNKLIEKLYDTTQDFIDIDFENMNVSRYDDSANIPTVEKTNNYIYACSESVSQKQGTFDKKEYEGETLRLSNSSLTVECYDKVKSESRVVGNNYDAYAPMFKGINYFRMEMQNKDTQGMKAKSRYGKKLLLKDVLNPELQLHSRKIRLKTFEKHFLPKGITRHEKNMRVADMIAQDKRKNVMNDFYMYQAMKVISPDEAKRIMKHYNYSREWISKEYRKLKTFQSIDFANETLIDELYEVIKSKV